MNCQNVTFKQLIANTQMCKLNSDTETVETVIAIFSRPKNTEARNTLRRTWLSYLKGNSGQLRYTFVFGVSLHPNENRIIESESKLYSDVAQGDFIDNYHGLTNKTMFAFQLVENYCKLARFLVKTDDDVFLNIFNLVKTIYLNQQDLNSNVIGSCLNSRRPVRNQNSKYYISYLEYPFSLYPKFCSGTCYVMSIELALKIRKASVNVPYFPLEDVYVGMCLQLLSASVKDITGFHTNVEGFSEEEFYRKNFISGHFLSPALIETIWRHQCLKRDSYRRI